MSISVAAYLKSPKNASQRQAVKQFIELPKPAINQLSKWASEVVENAISLCAFAQKKCLDLKTTEKN